MSNNLIGFLMDESGSMGAGHSQGEPAMDAANLFMHYQKTRVDDCQLVFATFHSNYYNKYQGSIFDMPEITSSLYMPQGGTALWDSILLMYEDMVAAVAKYKPAHVTWILHSDGGEPWYGTAQNALDKINKARDAGWDVVWMAELRSYDTILASWDLQFPDDHIIAYTPGNSRGFEAVAIEVLESVITNKIDTTNAQKLVTAKFTAAERTQFDCWLQVAREQAKVTGRTRKIWTKKGVIPSHTRTND